MHHRCAAVALLLLIPIAACSSSSTSGSPSDTPRTSSQPAGPPQHSSSTTPPRSPSSASSHSSSHSSPPVAGSPAAVLAAMTEAQRVGQLLMVDCPSGNVAPATVTALLDDHVGSVILDGTNTGGAAGIRQVTGQLNGLVEHGPRLFIATDQEGGLVQRLQGPGFSTIPSAVDQGALAPSTLRNDARTWGTQLRDAGVNVDLAPVLGTVPQGFGANPPIGDLDREYGHTPGAVASHGVAFAQGLSDAGIAATAKHFPGLGRVHGNTDTTSGVQDTVTTADDPYLQPFAQAVHAGVPFVMVSTAIYTRIDPGTPAIFSHRIVTDMLRTQLGFDGVVITDDVGIAAQVASYSVADRAVRFIQAGGDMVLTVDANQAATMTQALLAKASADPAFKQLVDAAVLRVLQAKQRFGLLG